MGQFATVATVGLSVDAEVAGCKRAEMARDRILWDNFGQHTEASMDHLALALELVVGDIYICT